ncbi:hypothetical protein FRC06_003387 [Ceratobasidium sp. 370]|nr:hypothetical protein FRC06_003387 [Ceratobasidium sp. 370]
MSALAKTIVAALLYTRRASAVGTAFGYATGTTGGGSAAAAVPTSTSQLVSWLGDSTARVILLDKIFDFTSTEGTVTGTVCSPWSCTPNPQMAIDVNNYCSSAVPTAPKSTATYNKAGLIGITVGSNKTLLGKGSSGGMQVCKLHHFTTTNKGKGLLIRNAKNVIIQNIRITDINPRFVWGGDAIQVDGSSNVWIDHNYFQNVGRQMIVTGNGAAQSVTISDTHSMDLPLTLRDVMTMTFPGHHYWAFLFVGSSDTITLARNYIYMTAGRGPHIGGSTSASQTLHAYNNYYVSITGHALDAGAGSKTLFEGNYFNTVTTPVTSETAGAAYAPTTSTQAASCSTYLGRNCYTNSLLSSGSLNRVDIGAVPYFQSTSTVKSASIMDASQVPNYVQNNAGVGIVN